MTFGHIFYLWGLREDFLKLQDIFLAAGFNITGSRIPQVHPGEDLNQVVVSKDTKGKSSIKLDLLEDTYRGFIGVNVVLHDLENMEESISLLKQNNFSMHYTGQSGGFDATNFYLIYNKSNFVKITSKLKQNKKLAKEPIKG